MITKKKFTINRPVVRLFIVGLYRPGLDHDELNNSSFLFYAYYSMLLIQLHFKTTDGAKFFSTLII